jgi:hypothetical protein
VRNPFAKPSTRGRVLLTGSLIIEHRFHLFPLGTRDAVAADLSNAFDFSQP